jgi:hypothetical protein
MARVVGWFSCGDASAVACMLMLKEHSEAIIARIIIPDEVEDSDRFVADCERWYGRDILRLQDPECRSTEDVFEERRFISGIHGAPCTGELKKAVRFAFQRPDDVHILGYTVDEQDRADDFNRNNFELTCDYPLIRWGLTKNDCHAIVREEGILQHIMYRQGFENANCPGCVKGGMGYWNRVRIYYPDRFRRMCALGRKYGWRPFRYRGSRIYLDELPLDAGRRKEPGFDCSAFCQPALAKIRQAL